VEASEGQSFFNAVLAASAPTDVIGTATGFKYVDLGRLHQLRHAVSGVLRENPSWAHEEGLSVAGWLVFAKSARDEAFFEAAAVSRPLVDDAVFGSANPGRSGCVAYARAVAALRGVDVVMVCTGGSRKAPWTEACGWRSTFAKGAPNRTAVQEAESTH
jgi:hypothetical protein